MCVNVYVCVWCVCVCVYVVCVVCICVCVRMRAVWRVHVVWRARAHSGEQVPRQWEAPAGSRAGTECDARGWATTLLALRVTGRVPELQAERSVQGVGRGPSRRR